MKLTVLSTLITTCLVCWIYFLTSGDNEKYSKTAQQLTANYSVDVISEQGVNWQAQRHSKIAATQYQVRFVCPDGGVSLFINGFLVFSEKEEGRSVSRITSFMKPGENSFELIPNGSGNNATLDLVDAGQGDDPRTAPILLTLSTEDAKAASVIGNFTIEDDTLNFKWHSATDVGAIETAADEIYSKLKALAKALEKGPDEELIALLGIKHKEIATAFDITKEQMDSGLLGGIADKRVKPKFSVDLVNRENFVPLSTNGTIINAMRTDGNHAIQIVEDSYRAEFKVSLAKIDGEFVIVR